VAVLVAVGVLCRADQAGRGSLSPEDVVARAERDMAARPAEAVRIARSAADHLRDRQPLARQLFARAARLQEQELSRLDEGGAAELAGAYANVLADAPAAERVQRSWLLHRERHLETGDGDGRVHLARLWWIWLADRTAAARLCQEALRHQPALTSAPTMLRDDLGYRLTDAGWEPAEGPNAKPGVRPGWTAADVRRRQGPPSRVARQLLFHRYLEQWSYGEPPSLWVEFGCLKGQEPVVLSVHRAGGS
jgi:hypothetical protein